ncbi:hypothetical protein [Pontibacter sp. HSC-36F09]|uniref:hypothetical protein n=1 Tax=Pontibacter sp. HSC-36F09 TaxID=2910966 RepID=UPI00209FF4FC|nr:hypothetical protein [Pontibacter sp. HSC-36F09]MCP2042083.1 hypothetical protein [Pontibacter sp. HSC-36F09]
MKEMYIVLLTVFLISCGVRESEEESVIEHQNTTPSPIIDPQHLIIQPLFTKEDIKGVWTSGETENASFSIEEDPILFVDALEYIKYEFRNDTLIYLEGNDPFFQTRVIKADKD